MPVRTRYHKERNQGKSRSNQQTWSERFTDRIRKKGASIKRAKMPNLAGFNEPPGVMENLANPPIRRVAREYDEVREKLKTRRKVP